MTKILLSSFILLCLLSTINAQTPATAGSGGFNYSSFTAEKKIITPELQSLTDKQFYDHPEFGVLPYNAPCKDCIELLQKRDETHRYFVKNETHGKEFYQQSSYGSLSYKENGVLRTIDPRIQPAEQKEVFKATLQPFPVTINIPEKFTSILNAGKELQVNRDVNIYIEHTDGSITSLGEPDWSHYTVGDDGMVIHNFYPGIDLEMRLGTGNIESFYRLNRPLHLTDGWLVIRDNMKVPDGLIYDYSHSIEKEHKSYEGTLFLNNKEGVHYFYIGTPAAYDENNEHDNAINLNYQITDNGVYDLYVPIDWMNDANRSYPLIIDPFVTATSTLPQDSIIGSGYNANCFRNGCTYDLNVAVPAACVVTGMTYSFNYTAEGICSLNEAAWDLTWGACRSPSTGGTWHTCTIALPGLCILQGLSCFGDFQSCINPQCASYNIPMVLTFYRCVQNITGCGFSCVMAATPWSMTVSGSADTVEVTTQDVSICSGSNATLSANATSDFPPYIYTWYPGGIVGNSISVSPTVTTTYTVTVSNCGGTDSSQATTTVTVGGNIKVTTLGTTICKGASVNLTAVADSAPLPYIYTWYPGGLVGQTVDVSPDSTTTYTVIATACGGLNSTDSAQATSTVTVNPFDGYNPGFTIVPDTVCELDSAVIITGLGTGAQTNYNWLLPGAERDVQSNKQNTYAFYQASGRYNIILEYNNGTCIIPDTQQVTVVKCYAGIEESYLSDLFSVYPNPSQGSFTIQSDNIKSDNVDMDIYNVMGEKVYSFVVREEDLKKGYQLRLNSSSGLYLLVLRADGAVMGKKISVLK